ncbi:MAG: hypothetical protein EXS69_02325 [Candidatus Zambryskibacteria bacterium]|nr:hypothetical protein [Candidatus Zambryskibacteria bacterium]
MRELQRKQKIRQLLYSWPSLVLIGIITYFLVKGAIGIMQVERDSAGRVKELEKESFELSIREQKLALDINKLKTEQGIVEEIKEKFSVTRDGEYVAIIVDSRNRATSTDSSTLSWYMRLIDAIIGE